MRNVERLMTGCGKPSHRKGSSLRLGIGCYEKEISDAKWSRDLMKAHAKVKYWCYFRRCCAQVSIGSSSGRQAQQLVHMCAIWTPGSLGMVVLWGYFSMARPLKWTSGGSKELPFPMDFHYLARDWSSGPRR